MDPNGSEYSYFLAPGRQVCLGPARCLPINRAGPVNLIKPSPHTHEAPSTVFYLHVQYHGQWVSLARSNIHFPRILKRFRDGRRDEHAQVGKSVAPRPCHRGPEWHVPEFGLQIAFGGRSFRGNSAAGSPIWWQVARPPPV